MTSDKYFFKVMESYKHRLLEREFLISLLTVSELPTLKVDATVVTHRDRVGTEIRRPVDPTDIAKLSNGMMFRTTDTDGKENFGFLIDQVIHHIPSRGTEFDSPFDIYQKITLKPGMIENHTDGEIETTVGRFVLNYMVLASVFGDTIPFVNDTWNIGKVESLIGQLLINGKIEVAQYNNYINRGYLIGHFSELCVPTMTEKSITTDPAIAIRKAELLKQYEGQLDDPNVIGIIEAELLKMDKDYLKGDEALGYHEGIGNKSFAIHRKKLFITVGGIESFDESGDFNFVENSLNEGWDKKDFATISNEVRKGSYSRGMETAKGGAMTKFILRVFQDLKVTAEDCGTKDGVRFLFTDDFKGSFYGRKVMDKSGKVVDTITAETESKYLGKSITLRMPTYCKTTDGLCYSCTGDTIKAIDAEAIGVLAVDVSSKFMLASLKKMHGSTIKLLTVDPVKYLR